MGLVHVIYIYNIVKCIFFLRPTLVSIFCVEWVVHKVHNVNRFLDLFCVTLSVKQPIVRPTPLGTTRL
jgi:hypothetical protein